VKPEVKCTSSMDDKIMERGHGSPTTSPHYTRSPSSPVHGSTPSRSPGSKDRRYSGRRSSDILKETKMLADDGEAHIIMKELGRVELVLKD